MSGILIAAFAGLLTQQAMPHPSTQTPYEAPAIRPFEPGSDFGREVAEGDAEAGASRRALTAPVKVEAYARSYEVSPTDAEIAYEQGVASAEIRTDQTAGPLDGTWRLVDAQGRELFALVLTDTGEGVVEGGWRDPSGSGAVTGLGATLTIEGRGDLSIEGTTDRRGARLTTADGRAQPVTLERAD